MYNRYNIVIGNDINRFKLTYELNNNRPSQIWAKLINRSSPSDLRPTLNPWRGTNKDVDPKIKDLNNLIDKLNTWLPEKIPGFWNVSNAQESLNRLHIHFPEQEQHETDPERRRQLSIYNDLIHEMEQTYSIIKNNTERLYLLICPESGGREDMVDEDYKYFKMNKSFGDLDLHYPQVGRHPFEVFINNDITCPKDQIIPQNVISGYHTLRFFNTYIPKKYFDEFYNLSNLEWPYTLDNSKLAVGYICMGRLVSIDNKQWTVEDTLSKVKSSNKIFEWEAY